MNKKEQLPKRWRDLISVRPRFQRSVHLERDAHDNGWVDGYLISPAVRAVVERLALGLAPTGSARAWSLSGPYGVGKSSLALFASHALGIAQDLEDERAVLALRSTDKTLASRVELVRGLVAVRATGERRRLDLILLVALKAAAEAYWSGKGAKPSILCEIDEALEGAEGSRRLPVRRVVSLFEGVAEKVKASNRGGRGLFVILDEAGKVLEHAAQYPDDGDMHLLQELAEACSRSGEVPIVFMVVLHQGFEQYATRLSTSLRNEWSKVQGRFEELPFQEAPDQVVRLIAQALNGSNLPNRWDASLRKAATALAAATANADSSRAQALPALLRATCPLHPVTAAILGPLFRSGIAQNERSLFAFLGSSEPAGFQSFLDEALPDDGSLVLYPVDRLYDYVRGAAGYRLFETNGRHWAQAANALDRLHESATELEARIVRTIAVLGAAGEAHGLRPSRETLMLALRSDTVSESAVADALDKLRERSVIVFRRYADAYQLWDGSDLDLDALIAAGAAQGGQGGSTAVRLTRVAPPRPVVPRRHAIKSGTLRYFEVRYSDEAVLTTGLARSANADGTLHVLIPSDERADADVRARLRSPLFWTAGTSAQNEGPVVVCLPTHPRRLRQVAAELAAMEWVRSSTAELRDDAVARKELNSRIAAAENILRGELAGLLSGEAPCEWWFAGKNTKAETGRAFSKWLSEVLDRAYDKAPQIHNELLNRNELSSAAASARRVLLQALIEKRAEPNLGIVGFPPEFSMYRSLLEAHGMHRVDGDTALIAPPREDVRGSLVPAYEEMLRTLDDPSRKRTNLQTLYQSLMRPPFGLRAGVLPVLVVSMMLERESEIALYEDGGFVSGLSVAVAERLLRTPQKFELQRMTITGARADVLRRLSSAKSEEGAALVPVVRELVRLATSLPDYARNTRRVSASAVAVREALLRAKEPSPLLFTLLPRACGLEAIGGASGIPEADADEFVARLKAAIRELRSAYPNLLTEVTRMVADALGLPSAVDALRSALGPRAARLAKAPAETYLRSFLIRAADAELEDEAWVISIATLLGGKPPESWNDGDVEHASMKLAGIKRAFRTLESLHLASMQRPLADDGYLMRLSVAQPGQGEAERVVSVSPSEVSETERLAKDLMRTIRSEGRALSRDALTAALALCARDLLSDAESAAVLDSSTEVSS